ncbi:MAG: hypothetical protein HQK53_18155 [Oligoflexia bacterium]|nr:hypothetical protein [Oligoflexia bacterium]
MKQFTNKYIFLITASIAVSIAASIVMQAVASSEIPIEVSLREQIAGNEFGTRRDLSDYKRMLGKDFSTYLKTLNQSNVWLDAGAGDMIFLDQYLDLKYRTMPAFFRRRAFTEEKFIINPQGLHCHLGESGEFVIPASEPVVVADVDVEVDSTTKATVFLVTYKINNLSQRTFISNIGKYVTINDRIFELNSLTENSAQIFRNKTKILSGRFFEDIPDSELFATINGSAVPIDLITDLYGVISYTDRFTETLSKFARILKLSTGRVYIKLPISSLGQFGHGSKGEHNGEYNVVKIIAEDYEGDRKGDRKGEGIEAKTMLLSVWMLQNLRDCFDVRRDIDDFSVIILIRNSKKECVIPQLKLVEVIPNCPPERTWGMASRSNACVVGADLL